jgi:FAD/FMN-containing dehydrogenase
MNAPLAADVLSRLKAVLGPDGWSQDPDRLAPKLVEWRDRWAGTTPILLLPRTVDQISAIVGICAETGTAVVPQGGNTGLVAGQIPQGEVLLSTEKMRAVRQTLPLDDVIVAEAGVPLAVVHEAAKAVGRRFPLSLASEGSATIGGLVSTNAGGTTVLRYGTMRDLVLGVEAVLPNGEVFHGLNRLRKDNTGYDFKQLLIGAEGTLGVVTAASLKLFPILVSRAVAFAAVKRPADAIELLKLAKEESGGAVEAFELIQRIGIEFAVRNIQGARDPLDGAPPWYVLIEMSSGEPGAAESSMERALSKAFERGLITDASIAQNETQAAAFWSVREHQSAAQKPEGAVWKHDVSTPISNIARFIEEATAAMERFAPGARVLAFGHLGDGNIHFDVLQPAGGDAKAHFDRRDEAAHIVYDVVSGLEGSISAEHGLGAMKTAEALRYKSPVEIEALKAVRKALDPGRIMNPRVLF